MDQENVKTGTRYAPIGAFNTHAAINRRLIDTLKLHSDLVDLGAENRGLNTTKGGTRIDRLLTTNRMQARFTAPLPLTEVEGSYHYPCIFTISWNYTSAEDKIANPLRTHAVKLIDLDAEQRLKLSKGLAALVVEGTNVERMSA